jgi:hypothetical protein
MKSVEIDHGKRLSVAVDQRISDVMDVPNYVFSRLERRSVSDQPPVERRLRQPTRRGEVRRGPQSSPMI